MVPFVIYMKHTVECSKYQTLYIITSALMQLSFKFQSSANHYRHLILAPNGEIITANTFITRSTVFFMIFFPQEIMFCSICII